MLEAGFLILLAVVAGLAELEPALIVLVMAVGWLLVSLIEYFAWRQSMAFATVERYAVAEGAAPGPVVNEMVEDPPPPPPPPAPATPPPEASEPEEAEPETPPQAEEETMVAAPEDEPKEDELEGAGSGEVEPGETEPEEVEPGGGESGEVEPGAAEEVIDFRPEHEINHRLEPLKPRPSRRWRFFGPRVRGEDDREEER